MLKVKKTITTLSVTKNEEFAQLRTETKNAIKNLVDEENKIAKNRDDFAKIIQQIKAEYQKLAAENEKLKKYVEQYKNEKKREQFYCKQSYPKRYKREPSYSSDEEDYYIERVQKRKPVKRKINYALKSREEDNAYDYDFYIDEGDEEGDYIDGGEGNPENEMIIDNNNSDNEEVSKQQIKKQPKKMKGISNYIRK